ncbi:MAG: arsenite methyltransferase [Nanoarchaeota archaeon]|nr:arsenite methyltransferase [Nanoarchaeota archaeon]MBU4300461.1 arsenite methyltransferase [Nanoarchaeota archaeon]MBU4451941.1 arsenite methyltransferase [Nanoarchaeota archaeon]MCG2724100.1 arsenite methyltransferase [archaeon]
MKQKHEEIKKAVREGYGKIAKNKISCCSPMFPCCGNSSAKIITDVSKSVGYADDDLSSVPEDANLGLGCGNPVTLASLKKGETVLDLGSGAGIDCFLAAKKVGETGRVIGIDMTPEMLARAKENAKKGNYKNVEFRLGEIENLPIEDNYVDAILSNCVVNLSPDKDGVFKEAFRVLKPGGRLMVSDIVLLKKLPESIKKSINAYIGCLAGATMKEEYLNAIKAAGFNEVKIISESTYPVELAASNPAAKDIMDSNDISEKDFAEMITSIVSIRVQGIKTK